jgi:predicted TIM-barrel fold metal-dependent hydrolase
MAAHTFRSQARFQERDAPPSEYVRRHLKFAPFAHEPVGWIVDSIGADLLVFGSDYPHPEGTSNPIERFEASMAGCDQATFDAFYHRNMEEVMGLS